jgi:hypothetical protein
MSGPDRLLLLWEEHVRAPFPSHLRGRDIDGEDVVVLDADIAGCVSSALSGHLGERCHRSLVRCLVAVEKVLPLIDDDDRAFEYYERLREMAGLVVRLWDATTE